MTNNEKKERVTHFKTKLLKICTKSRERAIKWNLTDIFRCATFSGEQFSSGKLLFVIHYIDSVILVNTA